MIDIQQTGERLEAHLRTLTETIGERSVRFPEHLTKTAGLWNPIHGKPGLRNKGTQRTGGNRRYDLPGDGGLCLL